MFRWRRSYATALFGTAKRIFQEIFSEGGKLPVAVGGPSTASIKAGAERASKTAVGVTLGRWLWRCALQKCTGTLVASPELQPAGVGMRAPIIHGFLLFCPSLSPHSYWARIQVSPGCWDALPTSGQTLEDPHGKAASGNSVFAWFPCGRLSTYWFIIKWADK